MILLIGEDWEMDVGMGLTVAEARRVRVFIRLYMACFAFKLTDLEGYKGKLVRIQLEDNHPVFSTSLQAERLRERRGQVMLHGIAISRTGGTLRWEICLYYCDAGKGEYPWKLD